MTAPFSENSHHKRERLSARVMPLSDYFVLLGMNPDFQNPSTALWSCLCEWKLVLDQLYLVGIRAACNDSTEVTIGSLFPSNSYSVFSHWYSGVLSKPQSMQSSPVGG